MPENEGVKQQGGKEQDEGVTIVGNQIKGTVIVDKNTKTPNPPIEITEGEGDRA